MLSVGQSPRGDVFFHHYVGVRPGYPEGVYSCQSRSSATLGQVHHGRSNFQGQSVPIEARVGGLEVQMLRNHAALHHQHCLDQTGDSGSRLEVADIGLYGTDQKRTIGFASFAVDSGDGVDLNRVAYSCSSPVRLQVIHIRSRNSGVGQGRFHHLFQCGDVRYGQSGAGPAVIHRRASDHPPDPIAILLGLAEALQDNDAATFAAHVTVRRRIERLALPVRRQHHRIRTEFEYTTVQDSLHTARNGQIRLALLQVRHRVVDRYHGRRARGVHCLCRSHEAQHERDPSAGTVQVRAAQSIKTRGGIGRFP